MFSSKIKKAICVAVALSLMANLSTKVNANVLVPLTQNNTTIIPQLNSSIFQANSNIFSMKSIGAHFKPAKKDEGNKVNRKLLDTYSGTCGTNVQWSLNTNTGKLTISGSGKMTDYFDGADVPWYNYTDDCIKSVTIGNGVTTIGVQAFSGCHVLTSITIPDSVTSIGEMAFFDCYGLIGTFAAVIPNFVTYIGKNAFVNCYGLTGPLFIPTSVTYIGEFAFQSCSGLTSVTIPNSVTSIGEFAFNNCSRLTSVTIRNGVTTIGEGAFSICTSLTSVTIPKSVTSIGEDAFYACTSLPSIIVDFNNSNYQSIDGVLFNKAGTTLVAFPGGKTGSYTIPDSVKTIDRNAFYGCTGLTSVTIPKSVTSIGQNAFCVCSSLTEVTYKGTSDPGTTRIFAYTQVTSVKVPWNYKSSTFCGVGVSRPPAPTPTPKASRSPTPSRSPSPSPSRSPSPSPSRSPSPSPSPTPGIKDWFTENVAWLAPVFTIVSGSVTVISFLLCNDKVKNFYRSHCRCCHKEYENTLTDTLDENPF